jgi:hypothetical protein
MSDEKSLPKIKNNTESNEPPLEYNPNIPMDTIKFRRRISRLNTSMRQIIKRIESRIPKNIGSIFDGKNVKVKSVKLIGLTDKFLNKDVEEKDGYNVFSNEDHLIKDLLNQFKEKNEKDKIPKIIRKKMAFNRLYNITEGSSEKLKDVKKSKKKYSLEEYQENILKSVDANSVDQGEIMKLIQSFNDIKIESNNVKALPPINIDIIKEHVYKKKPVKPRKKNLRDIMKRQEPLDEFEKEERLIKNLRSYKSVPKRRRNKNLDILPQYIRDIFAKNGY